MSIAQPDLALDWCHAKSISASSTTGNSDRARRADLARWARAIRTARGGEVDAHAPLDLVDDLDGLTTADLSSETLLRALDGLKRSYSPSTMQRQAQHDAGLLPVAVHPRGDRFEPVRRRTPSRTRPHRAGGAGVHPRRCCRHDRSRRYAAPSRPARPGRPATRR